jgi:hypothetical protein
MKRLTITVEGETTNDLIVALDRITDQIEEDFTSGFDRNDSGRYEFAVADVQHHEGPQAEEEARGLA